MAFSVVRKRLFDMFFSVNRQSVILILYFLVIICARFLFSERRLSMVK